MGFSSITTPMTQEYVPVSHEKILESYLSKCEVLFWLRVTFMARRNVFWDTSYVMPEREDDPWIHMAIFLLCDASVGLPEASESLLWASEAYLSLFQASDRPFQASEASESLFQATESMLETSVTLSMCYKACLRPLRASLRPLRAYLRPLRACLRPPRACLRPLREGKGCSNKNLTTFHLIY